MQAGAEEGAINLIQASPEEAGFSSRALAAALDTIRQAVDEGRITGVQVLVARDGKVVAHEAMGFRDLDRHLPMEKNSLLRMASTTKTFVATGILLLAQDGLLEITDPVSAYLPGFSEGLSARITVRDLLRHTAGFAYTYTNYVGDVTMACDEFPDAPSMIVEAIKIGREGPEVEPGTRCQYTNWAYTVLGGLLEQVSGQKRDLGLDIGYGLGWAVSANGSFGHAGFRGLYSLIDPDERLIILLFAQSRVGGTPGQEFVDAVYAALADRDAT